MRRHLLAGALLGVVNGFGAVICWSWLRRHGSYGWFSYSPMPRRNALFLSPARVEHLWLPVAVTLLGFVLVNTLLTTAYLRWVVGATGQDRLT